MEDRIARLKETLNDGSAYSFPKAITALALTSIAIDLNVIARQPDPGRVDSKSSPVEKG